MVYKLSITILLFIIAISSQAQSTWIVEGSDYKNEALYFYTYKDFISYKLDTVLEVVTDENGGFEADVNSITGIKQVYIDLGVYKASFYADSNREIYQLELPPRKEKTAVEALNIYFEPIELRLLIKNNLKKDINPLIASFDAIYSEFLTKNFDSIYYAPSREIINDFKEKTDNYYSKINNEYFETYRYYKISELYYLGPHRSYKTICNKFYKDKTINIDNEAYMHLFNLMFKDFFSVYYLTDEGKDLDKQIQYSRSPVKLKNTILNEEAISDTNFASLVLLKSLRDELMNPRVLGQKKYPKAQLNIVLDSIANFDDNLSLRSIAKTIQKQLESKPKINDINLESFEFEDRNGSLVKLTEFGGKYIYLNFMRTDVITSMESMDRLINFNKKHHKDIEVVTVFTDENKKDYLNIDFEKYKWNVLYIGDRRDILKQLNLITWPQFHLINPYGKFIISPAPSIEEKFEMKFFEILDSRS